jgi:hypothetical protein
VPIVDLTALEGADTPDKVAGLRAKARQPDPTHRAVPPVAAVCVYPDPVTVARRELAGSTVAAVAVASVATAFPSGRAPPGGQAGRCRGGRGNGRARDGHGHRPGIDAASVPQELVRDTRADPKILTMTRVPRGGYHMPTGGGSLVRGTAVGCLSSLPPASSAHTVSMTDSVGRPDDPGDSTDPEQAAPTETVAARNPRRHDFMNIAALTTMPDDDLVEGTPPNIWTENPMPPRVPIRRSCSGV